MREFTKQVITALKEDDWIIKQRGIEHIKSFLFIDTDDMQPQEVPFKFTWWERRVIGYYVRKLRDRMMVAKLIEYRLNPRKERSYSHENTFLH
jgi:hypothetical protein